jgi:hypothetical protein
LRLICKTLQQVVISKITRLNPHVIFRLVGHAAFA